MMIAIVTFRLPARQTVEQAAEVFKSTAPRYLGRKGLVAKHYFLSEEGDRAGGIYFWETKADAQACYTPEWRAMVQQKYGAPPEIEFVHAPVSVDNVRHVIESRA